MDGRVVLRCGRLALVLAAGVAAALPEAAFAQEIPPEDVARGVTVTGRRRPDFDPLGVRLGGFRLDANASGGVGWDSNVFGRQSDIVSDGFLQQTGNVSIDSDWTTHALGASASIDARQYFGESSLDWTDWNAGGYGRYDFSADTSANASYRHYRQHLDVYSTDVQASGITRPVPYNSDEVQVGGTTRFNRFGLLATGVYRTFRFENVPGLGTSGQLSSQSFNTFIGALGTSYALAPGRFVNAVVRLQDISYTNNTTGSDPRFGKDSFTWAALVGFQYDFDGVWQGRIEVGYQRRNYEGSELKNLSGPAIEGGLTWSPTLLTTVRFVVATRLEESIRINATGYRLNTGGIGVDHELLRNVIISGDVNVRNLQYRQPNQTSTELGFVVGAQWLINRNLILSGSYTYTNRLQATGGLTEYDRNLLLVRLRVAL
jgi:hypothetical protein